MIIKIILLIFALVYYIFCVTFCWNLIENYRNNCNLIKYCMLWISVVYFSPIITPFILGIEISESIKN